MEWATICEVRQITLFLYIIDGTYFKSFKMFSAPEIELEKIWKGLNIHEFINFTYVIGY